MCWMLSEEMGVVGFSNSRSASGMGWSSTVDLNLLAGLLIFDDTDGDVLIY